MFNRRILDYFETWRKSPTRKPLIVRGARQVGKTSAIKLFARKHYPQLAYLNLDQAQLRDTFTQVKSVAEFIQAVKIETNITVTPKDTLIFIDEIQNCPNIIRLLRYFYENYPDIHVITAGSLLEKIIEKEKKSVPVGRISYAYMYPLDFFEYLEATNQQPLLSQLKQIQLGQNIPAVIAQSALKQFQTYLLVGGMPEVINTYKATYQLTDLDIIFSQLLTSYTDDILKYADQKKAKYIDHALLNAYSVAGKLFNYSNFAGTNYSNKEMEPAFRSLEKVMIVHQLPVTKSTQLPLISQLTRPKKLIYLDIGLVTYQAKIRQKILQAQDVNAIFRGSIAEQVVGQNLLAQATFEKHSLNYWAQEKAVSTAELDFCFVHHGRIVGVEVKSGATGKLRSLFVFADKVPKHQLIRLHTGGLKQETVGYNNKKYQLLSVPIYLVPRLYDLIGPNG